MEAERGRLLDTFFALLARGAALAVDYDDNHPDFQVSPSLTTQGAALPRVQAGMPQSSAGLSRGPDVRIGTCRVVCR